MRNANQQTREQTVPYFGGIPTDHEVRLLRQQYPDHELAEGMIIPYHDVEILVECGQQSSRYRTITDRWRRKVEDESGIVIGTQPGKGFLVLNDHEKLDLSSNKLKTAIRASARSREVSHLIDRRQLPGESIKRLDQIERKSADIMAIGQIKRPPGLPSMMADNK